MGLKHKWGKGWTLEQFKEQIAWKYLKWNILSENICNTIYIQDCKEIDTKHRNFGKEYVDMTMTDFWQDKMAIYQEATM